MNFANTEEAFVYFTEANLATLETLCERKRTSMSDLDRQTNICLGMMKQVDGDTAARMQLASINVGRVLDMLKQAKKEPEGMAGAVHRFVQGNKA